MVQLSVVDLYLIDSDWTFKSFPIKPSFPRTPTGFHFPLILYHPTNNHLCRSLLFYCFIYVLLIMLDLWCWFSFGHTSINTVYYMAPFATMILAVPAMLLEGNGVLDWLHTHESISSSLIIIFSSGVMAFCLNFSIFYVIHSTTAVTFNVAGNLKVRSTWYNCHGY